MIHQGDNYPPIKPCDTFDTREYHNFDEPRIPKEIIDLSKIKHTLRLLADIIEEIQDVASIKEEIKKASTLNTEEISTLIELINELNKSKAVEIIQQKPTDEELDQIKQVNGIKPALDALTSTAFHGVKSPLHALVDIHINMNVFEQIYAMKDCIKTLYDIHGQLLHLYNNIGYIQKAANKI